MIENFSSNILPPKKESGEEEDKLPFFCSGGEPPTFIFLVEEKRNWDSALQHNLGFLLLASHVDTSRARISYSSNIAACTPLHANRMTEALSGRRKKNGV